MKEIIQREGEGFRIITLETVSNECNKTISHLTNNQDAIQWPLTTQAFLPLPFLPFTASLSYLLFLDVKCSPRKLSLLWVILLLSKLCPFALLRPPMGINLAPRYLFMAILVPSQEAHLFSYELQHRYCHSDTGGGHTINSGNLCFLGCYLS